MRECWTSVAVATALGAAVGVCGDARAQEIREDQLTDEAKALDRIIVMAARRIGAACRDPVAALYRVVRRGLPARIWE